MDNNIETVFNNYPAAYREPLLAIRNLIYETAARIPEVNDIEESLKWGQPSYVPAKAKIGSPIRLDVFGEDKIALFFHCQTTLISDFRGIFGDKLNFSRNRAIVLDPYQELPANELTLCIEMALTYHLKK